MSKTNKRKSIESKNNKEQKRQSVFERLGTKERVSSNHLSLTVNTSTGGQEFCRNWAQNGACPFGKNCKLSNTHILISPSKRNNKKDDLSGNLKILTERSKGEEGKRVVSTLSRRVGSPELNSWETWDQTELEYEDEKVLEKRRQLLQRELDLHMKKDSRKDTSAKVQRRSSSTSSCSSSSSGTSSSSVSSSESGANRRTDVKKKKRSTSSPSGSERNLKKTRGKLSVKESTPRKSSSSGSKKLPSPTRKRKKSTSSTPPRKLAPPPTSPSKNRTSMTNSRRKDSPERRGRTGSSERKKHRSTSRNRRRGSSPRPVSRRPRTPDSKISSSSSSSRQPRNRSSERKKEEDRKSKEDFKRRNDYRDKRDVHDERSREKARELREAAREKERSEALERCRERQREREAAAKEKDRLREERERERKEAAAKRDRDRKERRNSRERRRPDDKRHDRMYDRKISDERERRDRALERVMERKSVERSRERNRGRDSYERSRKIIDESPYDSPYRCDKILGDKRRYDIGSPRDEIISSPYRSGEKRRYDAIREGHSPRDEIICSPSYREKRGRYEKSPREDRMRNYSDERRRERNRPSWNGEGSSNRFEERDKSTSRGDWERDFQETPRRDWESRRNHLENEKDRASVDEKEKEPEGLPNKRISRGSGDEIEESIKKPRIEDTTSLQEELSDISDDADDILNREDVEFMEDESRLEGENEQVDHLDESSQSHQQPVSPERGIESRLAEDEGMVGLDFEEISDEELEEESKTNKGGSVGDALGVDWASLMATCKQRKPANESSARSYWETGNMLARIGISKTMASSTMYSTLKEKYPQAFQNEHDVAALSRPLRESKSMKEKLISSNMQHKQALSARADLSIRRQLCGLPVVTLETHQNIGFCQWTV